MGSAASTTQTLPTLVRNRYIERLMNAAHQAAIGSSEVQ